MIIHSSPSEVQRLVRQWKQSQTVAFVPTMGCLHEGHLKLIEEAKKHASRVVVSIFVNPLQFGPTEDFERYPRPFDQDRQKCEGSGVDLLFHPGVGDLYPSGFSTKASVMGSLTQHLCGKSRPGHFAGVVTVCLKLFNITQPDFVVFGQKDFQQLRIIERMLEDLNLPIRLIASPTVREADGLALSSRNRYLTFEERERAALIPKSLRKVADWAKRNREGTISQALSQAKASLAPANAVLDYLEIASENDLIPAAPDKRLCELDRPRLFIAIKVGNTRLIDNLPLYEGSL